LFRLLQSREQDHLSKKTFTQQSPVLEAFL
jgi:hypothetical protein